MFTDTLQNIFENYGFKKKKGLIKAWTWFFQLQLVSSSVRPDFLMPQKKWRLLQIKVLTLPKIFPANIRNKL